jgi:hypothetical protein
VCLAAARCSPARSGFRLARQLVQQRRRHQPLDPAQAAADAAAAAAGGRVRPWAAAPRPGRGRVADRAPERARARAPAASQVLRARVPAARLRAARQRAAVSGSLAARQRVARCSHCSAAPSCSGAGPGGSGAVVTARWAPKKPCPAAAVRSGGRAARFE